MKGSMTALKISAILFQEGEVWSAQCLEYDIATQADSLPNLRYELERVIFAHIAACKNIGREPFEGLPPAPQHFWKMFENSKTRVEGDDIPFRLPNSLVVPPLVPSLRVAETANHY